MENQNIHICSLIGRIFLISGHSDARKWKGDKESMSGMTDYDLIEDFINYDDAGVSEYDHVAIGKYWIFFSMSTKVEVFKMESTVIISEGLYFNQEWAYEKEIASQIVEEYPFLIEISDKKLAVFDAALDSSQLPLEIIHDASFCILSLPNGLYGARRVCLNIKEEDFELMGVEIYPKS
ncbi:MAG: hypothetical protein H6581_25515 [Bacteroidia bacterium]|nr:hypothetical protein [Bacteroidia bacterium]